MMSQRRFFAAMLASPIAAVAMVMTVVGCSAEQRQENIERKRAADARSAEAERYIRAMRIAKVCRSDSGTYFIYVGPNGRYWLSPYYDATGSFDRLRPWRNFEPVAAGIRLSEVC